MYTRYECHNQCVSCRKRARGSEFYCLRPEGQKIEAQRTDSGSGVLAPLHQQGDQGSAVSSTSGVRGTAAATERFSCNLRFPCSLFCYVIKVKGPTDEDTSLKLQLISSVTQTSKSNLSICCL